MWDRLRCLYNEGIKHSHGRYEKYDNDEDEDYLFPNVSTPIWLTNEGIECLSLVGDVSDEVEKWELVQVAYIELAEAISDVNNTHSELLKQIRKRRESASPTTEQ